MPERTVVTQAEIAVEGPRDGEHLRSAPGQHGAAQGNRIHKACGHFGGTASQRRIEHQHPLATLLHGGGKHRSGQALTDDDDVVGECRGHEVQSSLDP